MSVRNGGQFLEECLLSIQKQTFEDWELIVVNNHSTDNSLDIIESFVIGDSRINYYNNVDDGLIEALKLGYSKSIGRKITRMDADDYMSTDRLAIQHKSLETYGRGFISTGLVKCFSEQPLGDGFLKYETWLNQLTTLGDNFSEIYKENVIPSPCWMMFREDLDLVGGFNAYAYPEDYDLTFRCYQSRMKCIPSQSVLLYWRDYSTRTSRVEKEYADNRFIEMKCHYFLEIDANVDRPLVIWGAGNKGKQIVKFFISNSISPQWICNNEKKVGKDIYGLRLNDIRYLKEQLNPQIIIAVANNEEQKEIVNQLNNEGRIAGEDYFLFC